MSACIGKFNPAVLPRSCNGEDCYACAPQAHKDCWIQTRSNEAFNLIYPDPAKIRLPNIAKALGKLCRFNGQIDRFYSVAEHSVRVMWYVQDMGGSKTDQKWALLHDAAEGLGLGDLVNPYKRLPELAFFKETEKKIETAVAIRFKLPHEMPELVKKADVVACEAERREMHGPPPQPWVGMPDVTDPFVIDGAGWGHAHASDRFMLEARKLGVL